MNDPLKTLRKGSSAHGYHPFDLASIDHRHNARNDRHPNSGDPAVLHKPEELLIVKKQLGKQHLRAGIYLCLQMLHF